MGLLSKLFGSGGQEHRTQPAATTQRRMVRLSWAGRVHVVGESHYQPALSKAAGGRSSVDYEDGVPVRATLVCEPSNKYDRNAVRVDVDGRTVGYLARDEAVRYHPVLRDVCAGGAQAWCDARIVGGGDRHYGIFLHLASPELMRMANDCEGLELLAPDRLVTVSKRSTNQAVLRSFTGSWVRSLPVGVYLSLAPAAIQGGKHDGRDTIEARLAGQRVGELTMGLAANYLPLLQPVFAQGVSPGCEAFIEEEAGQLAVSLRMPRVV